MLRKFRKIALKQFRFRVTMIDNHSYNIYATNFSSVLQQHNKKFSYEPRFIYPLDDIAGTDAIVGGNRFSYRVHLHLDVMARSESSALDQFAKRVDRNSVLVEQKFPIWVNEREEI